MSFNDTEPNGNAPEQPYTPAREPDGLIVPASSVTSALDRDDLDGVEDGSESEDGPQASRNEGLDIYSINFAEMDLFASPSTTRLDIPNSDFYVLVKNELDFGEQATLDSISIRGIQRNDLEGMESNSMVVLDVAKQRLYNLAMHIVGWNFRTPDRGGKKGQEVKLPRTLEERVKLCRRMNAVLGQALTELIQKHIDDHAQQMKRIEAADEHRMGLMPPAEDEQDAAPKHTLSGASATPIR
jgi:hypothetical protein